MKTTAFWIRRFFSVTLGVGAALLGTYLLKGETLEDAGASALAWALLSASIFTATRYYQARRGVACALCRDTVDN